MDSERYVMNQNEMHILIRPIQGTYVDVCIIRNIALKLKDYIDLLSFEAGAVCIHDVIGVQRCCYLEFLVIITKDATSINRLVRKIDAAIREQIKNIDLSCINYYFTQLDKMLFQIQLHEKEEITQQLIYTIHQPFQHLNETLYVKNCRQYSILVSELKHKANESLEGKLHFVGFSVQKESAVTVKDAILIEMLSAWNNSSRLESGLVKLRRSGKAYATIADFSKNTGTYCVGVLTKNSRIEVSQNIIQSWRGTEFEKTIPYLKKQVLRNRAWGGPIAFQANLLYFHCIDPKVSTLAINKILEKISIEDFSALEQWSINYECIPLISKEII